MPEQTKRNMKSLFAGLQGLLMKALEITRASTDHPGSKGSAAEINWRRMLSEHLPRRYTISKGFVIDYKGQVSDEIDIIIHDRNYSSLVFAEGEIIYVPAESVYAILEIKPTLNRENIRYAAAKVRSVRKLSRTSAPITYAGGVQEPRDLFFIIGGILTLDSDWNSPLGEPLLGALLEQEWEGVLQFGCALSQGAFEFDPTTGSLEVSPPETALVSVYLNLLMALQRCGTAPAIDYKAYLSTAAEPDGT